MKNEKPKKKIIIKQDPEAEVPTEIMASAILMLSHAAQKLLNGRLKRDAIVVLIKDSCGLSKAAINQVLNNLEELEHTWLRK